MKNTKLNLLFALMIFLSGCYVYQQPTAVQAPPPPPPQAPPPQPPASYQSFYDQLAPYGSWVNYQNYGYVWIPNAEPGFRPYVTDGYWAYSDAGWTWVSNYSWGWAPFHYGRWLDDPYYGWLWVPGNDWAPAWVTWGNYNGYYGWAPIAPGYGVAYSPPMSAWCFTEPRYMGNPGWGNNYYVANNNRIAMGNSAYIEDIHSVTIINNTNNYNSRTYNAGPPKAEIENITRTPVTTVSIRESSAPSKSEMNSGSLSIYRPRINSATNTVAKPATVTPIENVKPRSSQPAQQQQQERSPQITPSRQPQYQEPAAKPQAPTQENNQAAPARGNQGNQPAQQQQAKPNNQASPAIRGNQPAQQQKNTKQNKKPVKSKPQPQKQTEQKDKNTQDIKDDRH